MAEQWRVLQGVLTACRSEAAFRIRRLRCCANVPQRYRHTNTHTGTYTEATQCTEGQRAALTVCEVCVQEVLVAASRLLVRLGADPHQALAAGKHPQWV